MRTRCADSAKLSCKGHAREKVIRAMFKCTSCANIACTVARDLFRDLHIAVVLTLLPEPRVRRFLFRRHSRCCVGLKMRI